MLEYKVEIPYGPGDWVWIMNSNSPRKVQIIGVCIHEAEFTTTDDGEVYCKRGGFSYYLLGTPTSCYPSEAYPTKEALVKSLMSKGDAE